MSWSTSLLFVPQDRLKRLCLLLVLQNKQRQAELEQWLEKSTNPRQDMSAWASGPDRVLRKGWVSEVKGRRVREEGGAGGRGGTRGVNRAASLNSVYHIRHGNITSIFFSLRDQSPHNPSKQHWNNSLFSLCGLGLQDSLCCRSQCALKVETIFHSLWNFNFFSATALSDYTGAHDAAKKTNKQAK